MGVGWSSFWGEKSRLTEEEREQEEEDQEGKKVRQEKADEEEEEKEEEEMDIDGVLATFEATVRVHLTDDEYVVQDVQSPQGKTGSSGGSEREWSGDGISRLDRYGDQPICLQQEKPHLRKFCLCRRRRRQPG